MSKTKVPTKVRNELQDILNQINHVKKHRLFETYFTNLDPFPRHKYKKHMEFFARGADNHMRLLLGGNRIGKSISAAYELTLHLTGLYPDWWEGRRYTTCSQWWVCGVDSRTIMSVLQPILLGPVGAFGTGMIPYDHLDFTTLKDAKKADTALNIVRVKHINGTYSQLEFKSYESGRESFQGAAVSIWLDEEPPLSIFTECLMRTATGNNSLFMTFTPLKGVSDTILSFFDGGNFCSGQVGPSKYVVMAGWDDVPHLDEATKKILIAATPPYQRDARTKGIPQLGSGAIFPIQESSVVVEPFEIPKHWPRAYGFDVGRNTAAVWIALDRESGIIYTYSDYYVEEGLPSTHAASIRARGSWIRGAIDTASRGRSQTDGENLYQIYTDLGLHIQNADKAVESGLLEMLELMTQGRLKIFNTCTKLIEEFRMYRRDEKGKIVKKNDHCCFTGDTIVHHEELGEIAIEKLVGTTGRVLSVNGYQDYSWAGMVDESADVVDITFSNGEVITCTPDHRFLTSDGKWVEARMLVGCNVVSYNDNSIGENQWTQSSLMKHNNYSTVSSLGAKMTGITSTIGMDTMEDCTELCGKQTLGLFQRATIFITKMATKVTTALQTWNVSVHQNIYPSIQKALVGSLLNKLCGQLQHGINHPKDWNGTNNMASDFAVSRNHQYNTPVSSVVNCSLHQQTNPDVATKHAESEKHEASLVAQSLRYHTKQERVYCLTVPETSCFAVGKTKIIGHNCDAWRYAIHTRDQILRTQAEIDAINNVNIDFEDTNYNPWRL